MKNSPVEISHPAKSNLDSDSGTIEIKKLDLATQDDEYNTVVNQIETFVTFFNFKAETKTVADATTARKYGESFIAGQNYINQIVNSSGSIDFHNK